MNPKRRRTEPQEHQNADNISVSWQCPNCNFANKSEEKICGICRLAKPDAPEIVIPITANTYIEQSPTFGNDDKPIDSSLMIPASQNEQLYESDENDTTSDPEDEESVSMSQAKNQGVVHLLPTGLGTAQMVILCIE